MTGDGVVKDMVDEVYGPEVLRAMDVIGRDDFYGIVAEKGIHFIAEKLNLTKDSRILDLGSGIGGPARYLAATFGCRVTGIDLSAFNHQTASERTRCAGLDDRVQFIHGDALETRVEDGGYTHVFGCEAWCYFPDKRPLYARARRALEVGGAIAFLEAACAVPIYLRAEDLLGPVHYESDECYRAMLEASGFARVRSFDTTCLAMQEVAVSISKLMACRQAVVEVAGDDTYYGLLELWSEFLACFTTGRLTHRGYIAQAV